MKAGWIVARAVDGAAVVIGHLPAGLRAGRLGQLRVPAVERKPNVSRVSQSHHVTTRRKMRNVSHRRQVRDRRIGAAGMGVAWIAMWAQITHYWAPARTSESAAVSVFTTPVIRAPT